MTGDGDLAAGELGALPTEPTELPGGAEADVAGRKRQTVFQGLQGRARGGTGGPVAAGGDRDAVLVGEFYFGRVGKL